MGLANGPSPNIQQENKMKMIFTVILALFGTMAYAVNPTLNLTNQFGEQSQNYVTGGNFQCTAIAANTILSNITGSSAVPVGNSYAAVSAKLTPAMLLTGFVSGAGTVASSDTVLQAVNKLDGNHASLQAKGLIPAVQAISGAGALSTTVMESTVTNAGSTYAVTLAAPSAQDGQIKIIKAITAMTGTVTLALTNVSMGGSWTPTGTATLTFTSVGDSAVFIAVGGKWVYLGGSAVAS